MIKKNNNENKAFYKYLNDGKKIVLENIKSDFIFQNRNERKKNKAKEIMIKITLI